MSATQTPAAATPTPKRKKPLPRRREMLDEAAFKNFPSLPDCALVDARVVCPLYGISKATLWRRISQGLVPQPMKLSARSTRWRVGDLRKHLREVAGEA